MKTKHLLLLLLLAVLVPWAAKAQNQLNEGFESTIFPPEDWTTIHVSGSSLWTITTSYIHTGAASAYLQNDYPGHENYLVTPKLVPNTGESLSFYATCTSGAGTTLTIEVSTTTPTAAAFTTTLATYTTGMYSGSNYIGTNTQGTWVELTIPATALTSYVGQQIYIAFHVVANHYGANIWLDDVTGVTKYVSPTPKPRFLTSSNITHEDATLSWQVPATATPGCYLYNYKKSTDANWGPEGTVSNGTSVDITGLDALTEYQFRVKADYGTIGQSEYVETSFTTTDQPTVISDSWSNDFEGTNCGLTLVNGTINNAWAWGTATNNGGSHGLYISNNGGSTNFYNITQSSMVYAYKTLYLEAGLYHFLYDWKANGESEFDFLRVALIPASVNLEASTSRLSGFNYNVLPEGWIALDGGSQLNQNTNWQTMSQEVQVATGGEYKMVFAWRNDGGRGTNPPAAIDNIYIEAISCLAISNLINGSVSSTTATLQWTENGNATAWQICLNNDEEHLIDVTSNPFTLTNLIPGTTYTAKMRANCGNENYSHWSNEVTFIAASFHFDEDFESISAVPSGWTTDGGGSWTFDNRYHAHGEQSAYFRAYGNGNTNKLITPPMDLSQVGLVELSFLRHMDHMTLSMNNELNVYYRTSTNGTWMLIKQYTDDAPGWDTEYFILPNTTNCSSYQIAFEATDKAPMGIIYYGSDVCIDYVRIESVNYPRPNALSCPNIDIYTATLAWTENGNATAWQICLNDDEEHLIDATSTSFQLTNLSSGTTYTAKVRAVHGNDQSGWSYEIGFTTLEPDPTPVGLHCTAATLTTATLGWEVNDNSVTGWQICLNGDETQLIDAPTNPFTLNGLTEGAICTAKVRSLIGNTPSNWSDVFTFQTATSLPYATSFESDCDWHLINGNLTNQWMIGTATHNGEGSQALYISNDGSNNTYSSNWSKVYACKTFDLNAGFYQFSYDWKCLAEGSSYLRVGLVPVSQNLVAESSFSNNQLPGGWINLDGGNRLNGMAEWQNVNIEIEIATAATYKMVFIWQNMFSPTPQNPPAAIDNVAVTATAGPKPSNLHCTSYTTTSVTLDWTENGLATAWQICLDGDESNLIEADTNPFTLTNLTPNTTYTAKVRANYGIVYSDWSDKVSFATIATVPYSTDFETDCDWNLVNGNLTNAWTWGEAAHNGEGTHGLYISNDGGTTNAYNNTSTTMVYAYKTFEFEEGMYVFAYDWIANGESNYDFLRVALVPDSVNLEANTTLPSGFNHNTLPNGWIALDGGSKLNKATEWQTMSNEVMIPVSGTYKMVFAWRNDNSAGTNPPAAIDNVSITSVTCPAPIDLAATEVYGYSAKLDWTASSDSYTVSYRTKSYTTGLYEQFKNDVVPTGWTRYSGLVDEVLNGSATLTPISSGWSANSNALGAYNMKVNIYGENCRYWLVTPEVTLGSTNRLEFDLALTRFGTSDPIPNPNSQADDRFVVLVYADGAWAILREWNNTGSDDVYNTIATTGEHISINLSAYAGKTVKIAFYGESTVSNNGDNDLHIDNVGVGLPVPAGEWQTITVDEASAWLTGLTPETPYEAKVQGDCGDDGLSEETAIISFTTIEACPMPTALTVDANLITSNTANLQWNGSIDVQSYTVRYRTAAGINQPVFSEGFENGLGDWTRRDCHASTGIDASAAHSGQCGFRFYFNSMPPQYLISPELSGITEGMRLEFYYRNHSTNYPETFQMGFSCTDNATESFTFGEEITASDAEWHLYSEPIPAGTKYICWKLTSNDQYYLYIDDIVVGTFVPSGEWLTTTSSSANVTLTGLTPETAYEAQVKSDCSEPRWSEMLTFNTTPLSSTPTNLQCTALTATSAELSWSCETALDSYTVRYRTAPVFSEGFENGLDDWTRRDCHANTGINASAAHSGQCGFRFYFNSMPPQYLISPELSGITEGMRLEFYYRNHSTNYPETFQMGFSRTDNATESFTFGEEITASDTQWHLYSEPIPAGTKYICWKLTSNDQYYLYIDDIIIAEWQTITAATTHATLTGLNSGTTYVAQVKGDCEDCEWSETVSFTTLETQTLNLSAGVNWVSFYVETTLNDLKTALLSALNNASGIKITSQNNGFTSWNGSSWRGSLNSIDVSQMYVIEVPAACVISLEAMPINPAEHSIAIVNGINWIGFPFSASMSVTDAFSGFAVNGDKVSSLNDGSANYQGSWSGGLSSLQPGQGYKLEVTTTGQRTFTFPTGAKKAKPFDLMGK